MRLSLVTLSKNVEHLFTRPSHLVLQSDRSVFVTSNIVSLRCFCPPNSLIFNQFSGKSDARRFSVVPSVFSL